MRTIILDTDRDIPIFLSAVGAIAGGWLYWRDTLLATLTAECAGCLVGLAIGLWTSAGIESWNKYVMREAFALLERLGFAVVDKETGEAVDTSKLLK